MGNRAVERYLIIDVAVKITLKYGGIKRLGKCGCKSKYLSVTFSETVIVWEMWLYMII